MNDRELLEFAAKAAGIKIKGYYEDEPSLSIKPGPKLPTARWNPLTDDGDALRLAVLLGMKIYPGEAYPWDEKCADYSTKFGAAVDEDEEPDPYIATRRAIVRAAAEIGKAMK
jgi:hypothetical protein